jgi:hypothetical protein
MYFVDYGRNNSMALAVRTSDLLRIIGRTEEKEGYVETDRIDRMLRIMDRHEVSDDPVAQPVEYVVADDATVPKKRAVRNSVRKRTTKRKTTRKAYARKTAGKKD